MQNEPITFDSKVISDGRITIPRKIRQEKRIMEGDKVHVKMTKLTDEKES